MTIGTYLHRLMLPLGILMLIALGIYSSSRTVRIYLQRFSDDPCELYRGQPSGFHWGPGGLCWADTSYVYGNATLGCDVGQRPNPDRTHWTAWDGIISGWKGPIPMDCVPGVSFDHRMRRDQWEFKYFLRDPDGLIHSGTTSEGKYWDDVAKGIR